MKGGSVGLRRACRETFRGFAFNEEQERERERPANRGPWVDNKCLQDFGMLMNIYELRL